MQGRGFDPQASLTAALGCNADNKANIQTLMALAIEEKEMMPEEEYVLNLKENLDLIPCCLELADIEIDGILITMLNQRTNLSKEMVKALNQSVEFIKEKFNLDLKVFNSNIPISVKTGEAILNEYGFKP